MTSIAKHAGKFELDAADGSTLTDYSSEVIDVKVTRTLNTSSYHVINDDDEKTLVGGRVQQVTVQGEISVATAGLYNVLRLKYETPVTATMTISNPDDAVGSIELSGEWILTGLDPYIDLMGGSGDAQIFTATFKPNGTITSAIIST